MKNRKPQFLLIALLTALALILSACQVNIITDIKNNGSGAYTMEIGFQGEEASMANLDTSAENFCSDQNQDTPPGTTIRQETRNGDETWCIYESVFTSLDELKTIYGSTDTRINNLSSVDGKLTYDITLDLSGDSSAMSGGDIFWIVTMPGSIIENNATEKNGNTLKWTLTAGQENNIRAVSKTGGLDLGGDTLWYILGGVCLCLCFIVVLIVAGVVFFLLRRKKKATGVEKSDETPVS
jgi:hypothetical protein